MSHGYCLLSVFTWAERALRLGGAEAADEEEAAEPERESESEPEPSSSDSDSVSTFSGIASKYRSSVLRTSTLKRASAYSH
jgi:hypothetical protein